MTTAKMTTPNLFDPCAVPGNHLLGVVHLIGRTWHKVTDEFQPKNVRWLGESVFIFNILPFRRKADFDIEELYRKHAGLVARRIRRFVGPDDVEEVLHEVFLKAFERRAHFRGEASPVTWLYNIATNHCLNRIRDRKRRAQSLANNCDLPWLSPTTQTGVQEQILLEQLWEILDDEQAAIAIYYFIDGLPHHEIARITGVSRRTIGNRLDEIMVRMKAASEAKL